MKLPVLVQGYGSDGSSWKEPTSTRDASSGGVSFKTRTPLVKGHVVRLALPFPRSLRQYDETAESYDVYAIVRNVLVDDDGCRVGVMFFGKEPPRGFYEKPGARFLLPSDVGPDPVPVARPAPAPEPAQDADGIGLRRHERFDIFVDFIVEQVDEWGAVLAEERTVAENLSLGGARVKSSLSVWKGDVLMLRELGGRFESRALVVNAYVGSDRVRRINLKFLDGHAPAHLVRAH